MITTSATITFHHVANWNLCFKPLFTLPDQQGLSCCVGAPAHLRGSLLSITHPTLVSPLHLLPPLVPLNTITHTMTNDRPSLPRYQKAPATPKWRHFGSSALPCLSAGEQCPWLSCVPFSFSPSFCNSVPSSRGLVRGVTWRGGPAWFISLAPLPGHSDRPKEPMRLQRALAWKPGIS